MIIFTVLIAMAEASETSNIKQLKGLEKKSPKVLKSARAYHEAKEECLKMSTDLKGTRLTNCIVEYQKKSK